MQDMACASKTRLCPVCGSNCSTHFADERIDLAKMSDFTYASRKQPEFMCLRLVRCRRCDLVYAPAPPDANFLQTVYSKAAYDSGAEAQAAAHSYAKALAPHIARLQHRNAAIDVGAGSGPLLPWLCETGFAPVFGIEPSRAAIEAAPPAVRSMLREGMFSPAMIADATPSLICSFMTLEHMDSPQNFTRSAYEALEQGGMLAVVVHNWRAPLNRLLGLRSPIIDVEHLQLFSPKAIFSLLTETGFSSIKIQSISNTYPLRYWMRLTPLPHRIKNSFINILENSGMPDISLPLRVGNMLAVAIK